MGSCLSWLRRGLRRSFLLLYGLLRIAVLLSHLSVFVGCVVSVMRIVGLYVLPPCLFLFLIRYFPERCFVPSGLVFSGLRSVFLLPSVL